jgi:Uma2 family endonuclease
MSIVFRTRQDDKTEPPPPLQNGDRLTQPEFHRRYKAYPEDVKFELVGGIVYMATPLRREHGLHHTQLNGLFWLYHVDTPGVEALDNATTILGEESEPQPDLALRILPEAGGSSRQTRDRYVKGPPELLAEISWSTRAIDMHQKREDYERAGVCEYLVVCIEERELYWFDFRSHASVTPDTRGIYRSGIFPGLWIDGPALLDLQPRPLIRALRRGLASPEHATFVKRLQSARRKRS